MKFKVVIMKFNYNGLWKNLIDHNMKKKDLINLTGISPATISKMVKGEAISLTVIGRICNVLGVDVGELVCVDKNIEVDK